MMLGPAVTVIANASDAVPPPLSVTVAVKLATAGKGPAVVGVPVIAPVVGFNESPAGSDLAVTAQVYGGPAPPVAARVVCAFCG